MFCFFSIIQPDPGHIVLEQDAVSAEAKSSSVSQRDRLVVNFPCRSMGVCVYVCGGKGSGCQGVQLAYQLIKLPLVSGISLTRIQFKHG